MFNLIPILLFIASFGGLVYIVSGHLSEFSNKDGSAYGGEDEENEPEFSIRAKFAEWLNRLPLDNIKNNSLFLAQKMLHRTRILLLKTDNKLMDIIGKMSEKKGADNGNDESEKIPDVDFWKDLSENNQNQKFMEPAAPEPEVKINFALESEASRKFFDIKPDKKVRKNRKSIK